MVSTARVGRRIVGGHYARGVRLASVVRPGSPLRTRDHFERGVREHPAARRAVRERGLPGAVPQQLRCEQRAGKLTAVHAEVRIGAHEERPMVRRELVGGHRLREVERPHAACAERPGERAARPPRIRRGCTVCFERHRVRVALPRSHVGWARIDHGEQVRVARAERRAQRG
jgi:hypothetical protein